MFHLLRLLQHIDQHIFRPIKVAQRVDGAGAVRHAHKILILPSLRQIAGDFQMFLKQGFRIGIVRILQAVPDRIEPDRVVAVHRPRSVIIAMARSSVVLENDRQHIAAHPGALKPRDILPVDGLRVRPIRLKGRRIFPQVMRILKHGDVVSLFLRRQYADTGPVHDFPVPERVQALPHLIDILFIFHSSS